MGHQSEYLTIATFADETKLYDFVDRLQKKYQFKLLKKKIYRNARPYHVSLLDYNDDYSEDFLEHYRNKIYDFNTETYLGYIHENVADTDLIQYRFEVDFDEYFSFLLSEGESRTDIKNKINKEFDTQFNIFFYYDANIQEYVLFQHVWDNLHYLLREYFFNFYDPENYLIYKKQFDDQEGVVSQKYDLIYENYSSYYEKLIVELFEPSVFIYLPIYLTTQFFDEDTVLNLNYYFLGNQKIQLTNDLCWKQIK